MPVVLAHPRSNSALQATPLRGQEKQEHGRSAASQSVVASRQEFETRVVLALPTGETASGAARPAHPALGAQQVLLDEGSVTVVMITGREPRFEIRAPGIGPEVIPATAAWRTEQKTAIERGQALIAA